jgi:hypothetical protein
MALSSRLRSRIRPKLVRPSHFVLSILAAISVKDFLQSLSSTTLRKKIQGPLTVFHLPGEGPLELGIRFVILKCRGLSVEGDGPGGSGHYPWSARFQSCQFTHVPDDRHDWNRAFRARLGKVPSVECRGA